MNHSSTDQRVVGQTKSVGFEIGVRRTFAVSPQQAWDVITSEEGIKLWLGDVSGLQLEKGQRYRTEEGAEGEIRVANPGSHIRLTWRPQGWDKASTVQVRVIPSGVKTVISFHQENLASGKEREQMRQRWQAVLEEMRSLFDNA